MHPKTHADRLSLCGMAAVGSGLIFLATVVYLFVVLQGAGFQFEMLDDRALLLPWVAAHAHLYGGLWMMYFASQALLLPVPAALAESFAEDTWGAGIVHVCARIASAAILLGMVGLVVVYTTSPLIARAYMSAPAEGQAQTVLLLGDLFADTGKEIRLFSELLLGVWLGVTGLVLVRSVRSRLAPWVILGVGAYTLLVAGAKLLDPFTPLEDTLGLLLALGYGAIGGELLRQSRRRAGSEQTRPSGLAA